MIKDGALIDKDIKALMMEGVKIVDPFEESFLQPASIDLQLGNTLYTYSMEDYVLGEEIDDCKVEQNTLKEYTLLNGKVVYVGLHEKITIPENILGLIVPRSSITRLGISITPIYVNPGYRGQPPLTIVNNSGSNIILRPGTRAVQLLLFFLSGIPERIYGSAADAKYLDEKADYSKLHMDEEIKRAINEVLEQETSDLFKKVKEKILHE
ncbi:MAG: dCTP deaminase [bacterium]